MKRLIIGILISVFGLGQTLAQEVNILSYEDFLNQVANQHPMAKAADLMIEKGEAGLLIARGKFDPSLSSDWRAKRFDEKEYYNQIDANLNWSSPFALKFNGGFEQSRGIFLNPENNTPNDGLLYFGVAIPLGNGLLMDGRRAELSKAKSYLEQSESMQRLMLNDLLFEAGMEYWKWFKSYHKKRVYQEVLKTADERFRAVVASAKYGDLPDIDTVEARIQLQSRILNFQQADLDYSNSSLKLSTYLWDQGLLPLDIDSTTVPPNLDLSGAINASDLNLDSLIANHPMLEMLRMENQILEFDRRLKAEQLKPALDLKYQLLQPASERVLNGPFYANDYTIGAQFNFPIFIRKERGELRLSKIKLKENELKQLNAEVKMEASLMASLNQWNTTRSQRILAQSMANDSRVLYSSELRLFDMGESSLFMVNSRELNYINARVKFIEQLSANQAARLMIIYNAALFELDLKP